jgi:hypothetical protein
MNKSKKFYRVSNTDTNQGLWYHFDGEFSGFIHDKFNFCNNSDLKMDFDEDLVGWISVVDNIDDLYQWFSKDDILKLQEHGWYIHEYESQDFRFYDKFGHYIIKQGTFRLTNKIILDGNH